MENTADNTGEEPKYMHYHELQAITEYFNTELGRGGFGKVYKGKCKDKEVAVKVLFESSQGNQDNVFKEELMNLMKLSHQNIIRLVGYCCETYQKYDQRIGKWEIVPRTALCIEYAPNGNLRKYTFDEKNRLDWPKVYNIIKGTCEGLYYLHHHTLGSMWHLDLKPENILLDHNMDPKIADFGLSKLFTNPTTKVIQIGGTTDYVPLEYKLRGKVTHKYDIFSLGVIIIEMMAGIETYRIIDDFENHEEVIKLVLEKWNDILSGYCEQVKACIEIAIMCVNINPKNRPELTDIIDKLKNVENIVPPTPLSQTTSKYEKSSTREMSQVLESKLLLTVHPLDLLFSLGLGQNKLMNSRPLRLTNNTDDHIVYRLLTKHPMEQYFVALLCGCGIVLPMSTCTFVASMRKPLELQSDNDELFVLESIVAGHRDMDHLRKKEAADRYVLFFQEAKQRGHAVHQVKLTTAYIRPGPEQVYEPMMITSNILELTSIDVHPTEPWILTCRRDDNHVYIWNYETQEVKSITPGRWSQAVTLAKFIASKQWIVAGAIDGSIYVYNNESKEEIHTMRGNTDSMTRGAITSLEIHATESYMLSASHDGTVKLWNYEKDWYLMSTIQVTPRSDEVLAVFDPKDTDVFAIAEGSAVQIWNWRSYERKLALSVRPDDVTCLHYFSSGDELYLIACYDSSPTTKGKIWDYHTGRCVHKLELGTRYVNAVCSHSDLQILITGSHDGSVHLWHSTTFRLMGWLNLGLGIIKDLKCLKDSRRIVIAGSEGLAVAEIDMIMGRT